MRQLKCFIPKTMAGLILGLASGPVFGQVLNYDVVLIPQGATGNMHALVGFGQSCAGNPHNGGMNFQECAVADITFRLQGPRDRMTCDNPTKPASRVITKIELTDKPDTGSGSPPQKGDFTGGLADSWLKTYAFPQVDTSDGVVYEVSDKNDGLARVTLVNMNSHPLEMNQGQVVPKRFWYRITAEDCTSNRTWVTDPRGDNEGLN